jgi:hypothetical protein
VTRRLPLRVRNRLAAVILAAVHDPGARAELERLACAASPPAGWLAPGEAEHGERLRERARRARDALAGPAAVSTAPATERALGVAAALFDAGLYFETHEVLEPLWRAARGVARETLQGLIQIAVGYQHWADGNLAGARSLLAEGSARLRGRGARARGLASFAAAVEAWMPALSHAEASGGRARPPVPAFPPAPDVVKATDSHGKSP